MKAIVLVVGLFLSSLYFSVASAQLAKITVGYSLIAAASIPAWMANETGIFRKNGLDV
jgi:ABC-type nitrate/sulfonate/bicarbonate transport system substrate-binding protein